MTVTILGTTDLHANITAYDYYKQIEAEQGLARVSTVVKEVRAANPNTILIDNGDTIQGTPFAQYYLDNYNSKKGKKIVNPMMKAMNYMKYDAWTLGNHEFNYGVPVLEKIIADANFPVLAANAYKADKTNFVKPYTIIEKNGAKIAILGLTNPGISTWDKNNVKGMEFKAIVDDAKVWIKQLKEVEKADAIIVSAHSGLESKVDLLGENQVKALATACPEITAILAGHSHSELVGEVVNGVRIVQVKNAGVKVAKLDLNLEKVADKWTVKSTASEALDVKGKAVDSDLLALMKTDIDAVNKAVETKIGTSTGEFTGINQQIVDSALMDLVQKTQMFYGKADISIAASFNESSRIPKGDVKVKDINGIYIYENWLNVIEMTGKQLKDYIEFNSKYFNQITKAGDTGITFNPDVKGYNYDMIQGVDFMLDLTQPAGSRLVNLTFKGKTVADDQKFRVALNNYRLAGSSGHMAAAGLANAASVWDSAVEMGDAGQIRTLMIQYIKDHKVIKPIVDNNYRLVTIPTTKYVSVKGDTFANIAKKNNLKLADLLKVNVIADGNEKKSLAVGTTVLIPAETVRKITLLSANDFHGSLKEDGKNPGIAKFANGVTKQRALNADGTLLLSAGDMMQGSADSNLVYGKSIIEFMNAVGFDALEIGNHEFDWGTKVLKERTAQAKFPVLAANLFDKKTGKAATFGKPYTIVKRNGMNIAIIGVLTPETATKTLPAIIDPYEIKDPADIVNKLAKELKESGKADMVVVLGHIGAAQDAKTGVVTGEAADLAAKVTNVDAIISGHTHTTVAGTVNNIPIVQGYYNGRTLGKVELYFDIATKKITESKASTVSLVPASLVAETKIQAIYDKYAKVIDPIKNEVIGVAAVELAHDAKTNNVTLLGAWATDVMRESAKADIAFQNGGGLRKTMPAGNITMGLMYEIMPFDNTIYTFDLLGSDVKKAIEHGINATTMSNGQFSGVTVKFDSSKPAGERVTEVKLLDGTLLDDTKYYKVATNDFQATGGDNYVMFKNGKNQFNTNIPVRDILVEAIKKVKTLSPVWDNRIQDVKAVAPQVVKPAA